MYRLFLVVTLAVSATIGRAYSQSSAYGPDSLKCLGSLSVMSEFAKMGLYEEAYDAWKYCFIHCPASSKNIYIIGSNILNHKIENTNDPDLRNNLIDTLMVLYDRRIELFGQEGYVLGRKGLDLLKYRPRETTTAYAVLKESTNIEKSHTEGIVLGNLMQAAAIMYNNKAIPVSEVIDNYFMIMGSVLNNGSIPQEQQPIFIESLNDIFIKSGAADCDTLEAYMLPKLAENTLNTLLLKSIISMMDKTDCIGSELNLNAAEMLFNTDPSSEMAVYIANAFLSSANLVKANDFYGKALELVENDETKAGIYCQMSLISQQQKDLVAGRDLALKALEIKPGMGEAYIAIGLAYAASAGVCGENTFESGTVYWAAVDKFMEAKKVDPVVALKADELISQYSKYFPDNETTFFYGYNDGDDYSIGCWINEKTTVRTRKLQQ